MLSFLHDTVWTLFLKTRLGLLESAGTRGDVLLHVTASWMVSMLSLFFAESYNML